MLTVAYDASRWSEFGVAVVGAAATLVGLLFVAVSINLQRILELRGVPARAGQTLVFLATPLFATVFVLVPKQPDAALAGEILGLALVTGAIHLRVSVQSPRSEHEPFGLWLASRAIPASAATLSLALVGITLLAGTGGGLYWMVPVVVVAVFAGISNAWVLLVEIMR